MDPYQAVGLNDRLDRQLAMSILMNSGTSASEAVKLARLQQQGQHSGHHHLQARQSATQLQLLQSMVLPELNVASYSQEMRQLQHELLNREISARAGLPSWTGADAPFFLRAAAFNASEHVPFSSLLAQQVPALPSFPAAVPAESKHIFSTSPIPKPDPDGAGAVSPKKRGSLVSNGSDASKKLRLVAYDPASTSAAANFNPTSESAPPSPIVTQASSIFSGGVADGRGAKAKLRDDFWGKVGKNNSHIHLVNIVLGRLLHQQVQVSFKKGGNKVLSNDLIQQILDHKLYGKYAVQDFFASSNKASETVRNTWTRLNFASDNIRKGLSRYKEQTWQAIERCGFDTKDIKEEDRKEMDEALKVFVQTGRFVSALDVALKGIITEEFICVLMQLRLEWNTLCLNCRPEEHDSLVAAFLRKYGLNGK